MSPAERAQLRAALLQTSALHEQLTALKMQTETLEATLRAALESDPAPAPAAAPKDPSPPEGEVRRRYLGSRVLREGSTQIQHEGPASGPSSGPGDSDHTSKE